MHWKFRRTTDKGIKENRVDSRMAAEASSVSEFNCADRTYMAVEVGRQKKIIPVLKGIPVTQKIFNIKNPTTGSTSSLKMAATRDALVWLAIPLKLKVPPMEINARGKVTDDTRKKVLFITLGKTNPDLATRRPPTHPRINGLEISAITKKRIFSFM